jgi:hypothetical protein
VTNKIQRLFCLPTNLVNRFLKVKACPGLKVGQANLFIYFDRVYDLTTGFSGNAGIAGGAGGGGGGAGSFP